jgi:ribosomal protein S18 acetylase RimI-like enzyme
MPEDAGRLLPLITQLSRESDFIPELFREAIMSKADPENMLRALLKQNHMTVLAEEDGEVMNGYLLLQGNRLPQAMHRAEIMLAVRGDRRRQGCGRRLVHAAEVQAKEKGIVRLELTVASVNRPAMLLFGTSGYRVEGIRRGALKVGETWIDTFYMAKWLGSDEKFSGEKRLSAADTGENGYGSSFFGREDSV